MQERQSLYDTDKLTETEILKFGLQDRVAPSLNPESGKANRKKAEADAEKIKRLEERFNALPQYLQNQIRRNR